MSIAALLDQIRAAPRPWTKRMETRKRPFGAMLHSPEPIVNMANPRLYSFTLPNMSPRRPMVSSTVAVTSVYPIMIQIP